MDISKMSKAQLAAALATIMENGGGEGKARPVAFRPCDKNARGKVTMGLFGLRRGPIALYAWEWLYIAENADAIKEALKTHVKTLSWDDNVAWVKANGLKKPS